MFRQGQQIGVYTLIGRLGKGGFGEVWLAEKRSQFVTKRVAVKLPLDEQVNFEAIRQEATLWEAASGHPNVLPIIDADVYDGQVIIVSEYADGGSLHDRLKREGRFSLKDSVEMTLGILGGLDFLHNRRIIHRDIKPQNILLQGNTPRLADFGISRAMNTTVVSSAIIGTDAYMSPESFDGKRNVQTDIWSVGVVLYQLLKGSLPFPQEHPSERMFAVLTKNFEPLPGEIPPVLQNIVARALAKQPEQRYQSCAEMIADLRKALTFVEHPTMAKTEVYINPNAANAFPPANTGGNRGEPRSTEKRIILGNPSAPVQKPPPTIVSPANSAVIPPTQVAFQQNQAQYQQNQGQYQQNSVATQFAQTPAIATGNTSAKNPKLKRNLIIVLSVFGVMAVLFAAFPLRWGIKYLLKPKYPPALQRQIDKAEARDPYFIYTERIPFSENGKYGYKDRSDKVMIPPKYDAAEYFGNGLGAVMQGGKWGFIDENDNLIIPFKYQAVGYFSENLAAFKQNDKFGFVDTRGNEIVPPKYDNVNFSFGEGFAGVQLNGKYGFINRSGKEVIPFIYDQVKYFRESLAAVKKDDKWGFIDSSGNTVIPFKYDEALHFSEDLAAVKLNGKYGFIDKKDNEKIPFRFEYADYGGFDESLAMVCLGFIQTDSCGVIDKNGREVVPLKYDYIWDFYEGLAAVEKNEKWGFVDKTGREVIPVKYDVVNKNYDGDYAEVELNGRRLKVDKNDATTDIGAGNFVPKNTNSAANSANTPNANTASNLASNTNAANLPLNLPRSNLSNAPLNSNSKKKFK